MTRQHDHTSTLVWTGNRGEGTKTYKGYDRTWEIRTPGKAVIQCSNDPLLGGDPSKPNPEDLLISALSSCHMLWYLHLASAAGITVHGYSDTPLGIGEVSPNGAGRFVRAVLRPVIELESEADRERADTIHHEIHQYCFIAQSVAFPVEYAATYRSRDG